MVEYIPSLDRKSGMPHETLIPAPARTKMLLLLDSILHTDEKPSSNVLQFTFAYKENGGFISKSSIKFSLLISL